MYILDFMGGLRFMSEKMISKEEILEVYKELRIPLDDSKFNSKLDSVWEIPPLRKGTRIRTSTSLNND